MGRYSDLAGTQLVAETDYTFDLNGRLTDLDHSNGTGTIANYDYSYDINNRITEFASPEGVSIYNYDDTDQLTEADHNYQVDVYLR
ncbi:YD repeat-containing protein (fragment) [Hyella patelloides LEGE 07179]|uniref:YD repeat-containing protein n=2 Tax=Hyella TaxID=945733 RepID=A0A563W3R3_9CYAN